ncbi:butyrophilin subfamily 3 member A3 isoform X3 [Equus caballus]|uniref:butyrophilin subfamily 3 member A3 isoform X3 n=1 Tax=Equus caballus TaxID=9796 RepID=UPI0038B2FD09
MWFSHSDKGSKVDHLHRLLLPSPPAVPGLAAQMKMASSLDFPLLDLLVCLILVQLLTPCSGQFSVIGPRGPILAMVGEDADLPCHLSPRMSAETMELMWVRSSLREVVYEYVNGKEIKEKQMAEYRGRTSILRDGITEGKATLRIYNIRPSDTGNYLCYFQDDDFYEKAMVELEVADPFFWRAWPWISTLAGTLPVLLLLLTVACYFVWQQHKEKEKEQAEKKQERREREYLQLVLRGEKSQDYAEWKMAFFQAEDVILDPDTANPKLLVSEDQRSLNLADAPQNVPDNPKRFDYFNFVLGCKSFTSGRHFWEVEVGGREQWLLGVCRENVERKDHVSINPQNGFWTMELSHGNDYHAFSGPRTNLTIANPPQRVGVFLDYESGEVSFYNALDGSHIYTFLRTTFSGPLRPIFEVCTSDPTALTICPALT